MNAKIMTVELIAAFPELSTQPVLNTYLATEWMLEFKGLIFSC